ncbi:MAG: hypothetical protein IJW40_02950 [Clostridia bacterium]|nr:hypothetical protein [Clostridia bacterium]
MKNLWIRLLALVLAVLMLGTMLVACADDTDKQPEKDNDDIDDTPVNGELDEDDPYQIADSLPEVSYGGAEFNILYFGDTTLGYFYVPEKTGDLIDDAVWSALARTEERFDVDIIALKSSAENEHSYTSSISTQIGSGSTDFDIANVHDVLGGNLSVQGYFLNILDFNQFDFSKPWWSQKAIDSLSYMDQLYLLSSTLSYNSMGSTQVVFFNKQLMDDRGMAYPYQDVLDMNWYLDDMFASIEDIYEDVNDNGKDNEDTYGVLLPQEFYAIYESFGINLIEKSADGTELILNANDERAYDLIDKLYSILYDYDGGYATVRADTLDMFEASQSVYIMTSLKYAVENFRDATFQYGIVPYPLMDERQTDYLSGYTERFMAIPNTCLDLDYVGTILESMSAEGYRQVLPAYYETALKGRYTHDNESVQMLEIIRESRVIDFAYVYSNNTACCRALYELLTKQSKDYASYYAGKASSAETRIEELTDYFTDMAD